MDDFDQTLDVQIVVRDLPADDALARRLLELTEPLVDEQFAVGLPEGRAVLGRHLRRRSPLLRSRARFFRADPKGDGFEVVRAPDDATDGWEPRLRPGEVIVVDSTAKLFVEGVVSDAPGATTAEDVFITASKRQDRLVWIHTASDGDAGDRVNTASSSSTPISRRSAQALQSILADQGTSDTSDGTSPSLSEQFEAAGIELPGIDKEFVDDPAFLIDAVPAADAALEGGEIIVVARLTRFDVLEELREVRSPGARTITLASHQDEVGRVARQLAGTLGLPSDVAWTLERAGQLHDEGKNDRRFQALLRRGTWPPDGAPALAKSRTRSWSGEQRFRAEAGLIGWRHEQLSAVFAFRAVTSERRAIVTRLVGTSHGFGRSSFDASAKDLLVELSGFDDAELHALAAALYDRGEWESIVERTHDEYGFWGTAYLEALVRAADVTVSAKGK